MWRALLLVLVGCRSILGIDDAQLTDAGVSGADSNRDGCSSFSTMLDTCALSFAPMISLAGTNTYDTGTGRLVDAAGNAVTPPSSTVLVQGRPVTVLALRSFELAPVSRLTVIGSNALAIVATGGITIDGTFDLAGGGAGHRASTCGGAGQDRTGGAGGGGGGGFGAPGGVGGRGDSDGLGSTAGVAGGITSLDSSNLLGGCAGGNGGSANGSGGLGGRGGGAVLFASAQIVDVAGIITAGGGGGGRGLTSDGGGGGGGSGGMIVIEAPLFAGGGTVAANGGGGGGGASNILGASDGTTATTGNVAPGGQGGATGNGGSGGAQATSTTSTTGTAGAQSTGGGGGGGGGVGRIVVRGTSSFSGTITPLATP